MTNTLCDLLKDVKKSILEEVNKKDPIISIDKNDDGLVINKASGEKVNLDLSHFNADMANISKGDRGEKGEAGDRGLTIKGDRGEPGRAGNSITNIRFDQRGHLIIETDDKTYDLGLLKRSGGTIIKKTSGSGGLVHLDGDVDGLTDIQGITHTTLQPTDHVFDVINQAPTYQYPEFTEFSINFPSDSYEIGEVIPDGSYEVTFVISNIGNTDGEDFILKDANTDTVLAILSNSPQSLNTNGDNFTLSTPGYYKFELSGVNSKGETFSKLYEVSFTDRLFYGNSANQTITSIDVETFGTRLTSVVKEDYLDVSYSAEPNQYKWICTPARFGSEYFFEDSTTGIQLLMEESDDLDITNSQGITTLYKTYRSTYRLSSDIKLRLH